MVWKTGQDYIFRSAEALPKCAEAADHRPSLLGRTFLALLIRHFLSLTTAVTYCLLHVFNRVFFFVVWTDSFDNLPGKTARGQERTRSTISICFIEMLYCALKIQHVLILFTIHEFSSVSSWIKLKLQQKKDRSCSCRKHNFGKPSRA